MLSNRIKLVRQANRLSLQQLADNLSSSGSEITRATLSNYETGKSVPNAALLTRLARELGVPIDFFDRPDWTDFSISLFTPPDSVPLRMQELTAYIQIELERYISLDRLLKIPVLWQQPQREVFHTYDASRVEELAQRVRSTWDIGAYPLSSVCGLLESHGMYLLSIPPLFGIRNLSGYEDSTGQPFIFYTANAFVDEFRRDLLEEMGRFFINADASCEAEVLLHFARALLLPAASVLNDFGEQRQHISYDELTIAKQKYGISRRSIVHRLRELEIISAEFYTNYWVNLRQHSFLWRDSNMSAPLPLYEAPMLYNMKYARALEEELLTPGNERLF